MVLTPTIVSSGDHHHHGDGNDIFLRKGSKVQCGTTLLLVRGLTFTILGIIFCVWTPFEIIMNERLRMHKGLPPYELWASPPDEVVMSAYVYNYTNAEAFMNGDDDVLQVVEIGPILYRELLTHSNITRNANNTISFVAKHTAILWDEANKINMNDTITVPNYAALSMATFLNDAPFFVKLGFNLLLRQLQTDMFRTMTVQNFLWNFTDPILSTAHKLIPHLAPIKNIGMLERIYQDFEDTYTMFIGAEHGIERFSLIDKIEGSDRIPNYKTCEDKVTNATEGVTYGQYLTRQTVLKYWRKSVCKVVNLIYERDEVRDGIDTYLYVVPNNSYDRTYPSFNDCYKGQPSLPNGLTDVSNCMYNVPIVASFPHFLYADPTVSQLLEGLAPNASLHNSYVYAEPITGVPVHSVARSQSNLAMRKMGGFADGIQRFSNRVLPMFWLEYNQRGIPMNVYLLVYGASVLLKPGQIVFICTLFLVGFYSTVRFGRQFTSSEDYQRIAKKCQTSSKRRLNRRFTNDSDSTDRSTSIDTEENLRIEDNDPMQDLHYNKETDSFIWKNNTFINSNIIC